MSRERASGSCRAAAASGGRPPVEYTVRAIGFGEVTFVRGRTRLMAVIWVAAALAAAVGAQDTRAFSFGVIADIQYRDADNQGTRFYRDSLEKLRRAVEHLNALAPRFTIQLGDLIDGESRSYDAVLPILGALAMPRYHVLGNHDFSVEPAEKRLVLARLNLASGTTRRCWRSCGGTPALSPTSRATRTKAGTRGTAQSTT